MQAVCRGTRKGAKMDAKGIRLFSLRIRAPLQSEGLGALG
jgi:hypothetical protein